MKDSYSKIKEVDVINIFEGNNKEGNNSIVFLFKNNPCIEIETKYIKSKIIEVDGKFRLFINLINDNPQSLEVFGILKKDFIYIVNKATNEEEAYKLLGERLIYWQETFKKNSSHIDEQLIKGYIGELYFLKYYVKNEYNIEEGIKGWIGYQKSNQDFHLSDSIIEVKTISNNSSSILISNYNQLTFDMIIAVLKTNKSSILSNKSFNLYKVIREIEKEIISPNLLTEFYRKLLELGFYPIEELEIYNKYIYEFENEINMYYIDETFPIINHSDINSAIINYKYEISLPMIENYIIKDWRKNNG